MNSYHKIRKMLLHVIGVAVVITLMAGCAANYEDPVDSNNIQLETPYPDEFQEEPGEVPMDIAPLTPDDNAGEIPDESPDGSTDGADNTVEPDNTIEAPDATLDSPDNTLEAPDTNDEMNAQ